MCHGKGGREAGQGGGGWGRTREREREREREEAREGETSFSRCSTRRCGPCRTASRRRRNRRSGYQPDARSARSRSQLIPTRVRSLHIRKAGRRGGAGHAAQAQVRRVAFSLARRVRHRGPVVDIRGGRSSGAIIAHPASAPRGIVSRAGALVELRARRRARRRRARRRAVDVGSEWQGR